MNSPIYERHLNTPPPPSVRVLDQDSGGFFCRGATWGNFGPMTLLPPLLQQISVVVTCSAAASNGDGGQSPLCGGGGGGVVMEEAAVSVLSFQMTGRYEMYAKELAAAVQPDFVPNIIKE